MKFYLLFLVTLVGCGGTKFKGSTPVSTPEKSSDASVSPAVVITPEIVATPAEKTPDPIVAPPPEKPPLVVDGITCSESSRVRYAVSSATFPAEKTCEEQKETQLCTKGVWSGTYTFEKCTQNGTLEIVADALDPAADRALSNGSFQGDRVDNRLSGSGSAIMSWAANNGSAYMTPWISSSSAQVGSLPLTSGNDYYTTTGSLSGTYSRVLLWVAMAYKTPLGMNADTTAFTYRYRCPNLPASGNRIDIGVHVPGGGVATLSGLANYVKNQGGASTATLYRDANRATWVSLVHQYIDTIVEKETTACP